MKRNASATARTNGTTLSRLAAAHLRCATMSWNWKLPTASVVSPSRRKPSFTAAMSAGCPSGTPAHSPLLRQAKRTGVPTSCFTLNSPSLTPCFASSLRVVMEIVSAGDRQRDHLAAQIGVALDLRPDDQRVDRIADLARDPDRVRALEHRRDQVRRRGMREVDLAVVDRRDHAVGAALDQHGFELDPLAREEALALRDIEIERADIAHGRRDFSEPERGLRGGALRQRPARPARPGPRPTGVFMVVASLSRRS